MSKKPSSERFFQVFRRIPELELRSGMTVTFVAEVDLTKIEKLRSEATLFKPSYTAFVVKALALALRQHPYANQRISRRIWLPFAQPKLQSFQNCDIAVAVERNLPGADSVAFVDIMRDVDEKNLKDISQWLAQLSKSDESSNEQWRQLSKLVNNLPTWLAVTLIRLPFAVPRLWEKYRGSAALVTAPAKYGVDTVVACWSWPVGVSFGLVKQRAVVREGKVVACPTFNLICNFDRRIMAGAQAGRFFATIVKNLEMAQI